MDLKHYDHDGRARFITFCTHGRKPILSNAEFRDIVSQCIRDICSEADIDLLAFVVMPEHVHLAIVPPEPVEVGRLVGELKRRTAKEIHEHVKGSPLEQQLTIMRNGRHRFVLWQRRCFDHNIRSPEKVWEKVRYCMWNPVTRGLVKSPRDWLWSGGKWKQAASASEIDPAPEP